MDNILIQANGSDVPTGVFAIDNNMMFYASNRTIPDIQSEYIGQSTINGITVDRSIVSLYRLGLRLGNTNANSNRYVSFDVWDMSGNMKGVTFSSYKIPYTTSNTMPITYGYMRNTTDPSQSYKVFPVLQSRQSYLFGNHGNYNLIANYVDTSNNIDISQNVYKSTVSILGDFGTLGINYDVSNAIVVLPDSSIMGNLYYISIPSAPIVTLAKPLLNGIEISFYTTVYSNNDVDLTGEDLLNGCNFYYSTNNINFAKVTAGISNRVIVRNNDIYTISCNFKVTSGINPIGKYYCKVAVLNSVTFADNILNPGYNTQSKYSDTFIVQFNIGSYFVKIRNLYNTDWDNAIIKTRDISNNLWNNAFIFKRDLSTNTYWRPNI